MKFITYPAMFLTGLILSIFENVFYMPFELLGYQNLRHKTRVSLRKIDSRRTTTYKPYGFFGLAERFFLEQKLESNRYIFFDEISVKHMFESEINFKREPRVFRVPQASLEVGTDRKFILRRKDFEAKSEFSGRDFENHYILGQKRTT